MRNLVVYIPVDDIALARDGVSTVFGAVDAFICSCGNRLCCAS